MRCASLLGSFLLGCLSPKAAPPAADATSAGAKAKVHWYLQYRRFGGGIQEIPIGSTAGTVPDLKTEAECTYDAVMLDEGQEARWVRCAGPNWRCQTIASCAANLSSDAPTFDHSIVIAAGADKKQFGVGLRCETVASD
jgi:hypothetical protein